MKYFVRIMPRAKADFQDMFSFIRERSHLGASRWKEAFEDAVAGLRNNPFIYGLAPEDEAFPFELRQLLFRTSQGRTYRAVYLVEGSDVLILRICGPGQAPLQPDELPMG